MTGGLLRFVTVLVAFTVVLSAATLYRVKTETREIRSEIHKLERRREATMLRLDAIKTEWAYLNSPGYLAELVGRHADELQLEERVPDNFARLIEIPPRGALSSVAGEAE